jgi:hypothetical protein
MARRHPSPGVQPAGSEPRPPASGGGGGTTKMTPIWAMWSGHLPRYHNGLLVLPSVVLVTQEPHEQDQHSQRYPEGRRSVEVDLGQYPEEHHFVPSFWTRLIGRQAVALSPGECSPRPVSPPQPRRSTRQIRTTSPGIGRWGGGDAGYFTISQLANAFCRSAKPASVILVPRRAHICRLVTPK